MNTNSVNGLKCKSKTQSSHGHNIFHNTAESSQCCFKVGLHDCLVTNDELFLFVAKHAKEILISVARSSDNWQ